MTSLMPGTFPAVTWCSGDKADLAGMKARELCELDAFYVECEDDEPEPGGGRQEEHYLIPGSGFRLLVSELHMFLVTWYSIAKCLSQAAEREGFSPPAKEIREL